VLLLNRLKIPTLLATVLAGGAVHAAPPERNNAYALLVGSNRAGPGQKELRFAREDARRVSEVLTQLGGYSQDRVVTVLDPGRQQLLDAFDRIATRLKVHADRGEDSLFLFYYSGHARARALNMGPDELALADLRQRLTALPTTVTVAILDACQTGAISRVKGATPAADFSYNSVNDLKTAGVAVMASSSASELSQEADTLRSSYFTHHLVVGLRGAADEDTDGSVTLSEAYRYAYNRTLVATAATAVGKQHVTLETKLRGKGEMVLTYPARATSVLELPARLEGQVLVHRASNKVVVAELSKASGRALRLALPGGRYVAFVRPAKKGVLRCELTLPDRGNLALATDGCESVQQAPVAVKGAAPAEPWRETVSLEVGLGAMRNAKDDYTATLEDFRFEEQWDPLDRLVTFSVAATYGLTRHISLVAGWTMLDGGAYKREAFDADNERRNQWFEWSAHAIGLYARWTLPLFRGHLNPYLQAGGGLAWGTSAYRDTLQASPVVDDQLHWGFHLAIAGGLQLMPWRYFGFFGQMAYLYAPVVKNEVGQTHDSGGPSLVCGLRGAL
jgi:hypothetical protein